MEQFSPEQIHEFRIAFDHFDEDHSGDLSIDEILKVLRSQGVRMTEKEIIDLVAEIDTDGNGTIDFPEFIEAMAATKQNMNQINRFKRSVQMVIKFEREMLPVFLPRDENDPHFEAGELGRQSTLKRIATETENAKISSEVKRSASRAVLESQSRRELIRTEKSRKDVKHGASVKKGESKSILSRFIKKEAKPTPKPRHKGSVSAVDMLGMVLLNTPITEENADEDENVVTYQAFDDRSTKLFSPLVGKILAETPHMFCLKVSTIVDNISVYDENFQTIKVLGVSEGHSEQGLVCFYGTVTIPSRCQKVLVACRTSTAKDKVTYDVFCHYEIQSLIEFRAKQTTLDKAVEAMLEAQDMKDYFGTVESAESVLYYDSEHWEALICLGNALLKLGEYRKAVKTADQLIRIDSEALPRESPHRLRAYEIKARAERHRGLYDQCAEQCKLGLKLFGQSAVLQEELELSLEELAKDSSPARWVVADKHARSITTAHSAPELAAALAEPFERDFDKVRAFFRWITINIAYDVVHLKNGSYSQADLSAEGCLLSRKAVCQGYCNLFKALCDSEGFECVTIRGFARTDLLSVDTMNVPNHVWNAFNVDGTWHFVDVTWACGTLKSDFTFNTEFNGVFWMTDAEFFLNSHFPEDRNWQLNPIRITKEDFCRLVPLTSHMLQTGLHLESHKNVEIKAAIGEKIEVELIATKPDRVYLATDIVSLTSLETMNWPCEVKYEQSSRVHRLVLTPQDRGLHELVVYYSFEETGTFNSLLTYKIVAF